MVGVFVQQHFLPFYSETFLNCEAFRALKAEAQYSQHFHKGKYVEDPGTKGKISGFGEFIKKSIKSEQGNATIPEVQVKNGLTMNMLMLISINFRFDNVY